jgi:hypothetical protein
MLSDVYDIYDTQTTRLIQVRRAKRYSVQRKYVCIYMSILRLQPLSRTPLCEEQSTVLVSCLTKYLYYLA